jgi:oligosaccharide translocation protein RFT1
MPASSPPQQPSAKFLSGLSALVLLQAASRIVTFVLNQALVRLASPAIFGTAAIQFELLLSSILFLCREGVRLALLRAPEPSLTPQSPAHSLQKNVKLDKGKKSAKPAKPARDPTPEPDPSLTLTVADDARLASNISTLPFLGGIPVALGLGLFYYTKANEETSSQPNFLSAIAIYVLAAIIELAAEPLYVRAQNELQFGLRVTSEGVGVILRTLTTVSLLLGAPPQWNLLAFALGQLAYALSIFTIYWNAYRTDASSLRLWPVTVTRTVKEQWVPLSLLRIV